MSNIWFTSDTHFGHRNIITFTDNEQKLIRPFASPEEMDEVMVKNWNDVVGQHDRVYHLGDVVINRRCLPTMKRLKGRICLIKGNHDIFPLRDYLPYFDDIRAYRVWPKHGIIASHIPVHVNQLKNRFSRNVHGHTHQNFVKRRVYDPATHEFSEQNDERYINVCVEKTDFRPITFDEVLARCKLS